MNNFDYTVSTKKSFDEAVKSVEEETKKQAFASFISTTSPLLFRKKNFQIEPFKIVEICNAKKCLRRPSG